MAEKMIMDRPIRGSGLLTVREAAEYLGVSRQTVYEWKAQGILAHVKLGRKLMFRQRDLDEFIQRNWKPPRDEYPLTVKIKAKGPVATHAIPRSHWRSRGTRIGIRIFHSHPSARRHLLRIWRSARKG
jgi:excisionase family DNA binding protein